MQRPHWLDADEHLVMGRTPYPEIDAAIMESERLRAGFEEIVYVGRASVPASMIRIGHEPELPKRHRLRGFLRNFQGIWLVVQFVVYGSAVIAYVWSVRS